MVVMKTTTLNETGIVPESFMERFGTDVTGILSGFDRLRLRGTLRLLYMTNGMAAFLGSAGIRLKDFAAYAEGWTQRVRCEAMERYQRRRLPAIYLPSVNTSKEATVAEIARAHPRRMGPLALLACVEPCLSFAIRGNRETGLLEPVLTERRCTHLYHYWRHEQLGLMHVRLQTWFPFAVDVCVNGREWLGRQMDRLRLGYVKQDNCFTWLKDPAKAQALLDAQVTTAWGTLLDELLQEAHPLHRELTAPLPQTYYWTASQSEYATDLMFRDAAALARHYSAWARHAISAFGSPDVLRFLGERVQPRGTRLPARFKAEVCSSCRERPEGVRIKHSVAGNSIKMYDKQGSVLRVETTINQPGRFQVYRRRERDPEQRMAWQPLRKGVADLHRRSEVSRAANRRYLQGLLSACSDQTAQAATKGLVEPIVREGRRHRALNPWSVGDHALLQWISRGEYALAGVRNRDLRQGLCSRAANPRERRRQAAAMTRKLALLKAHGVIRRLPGTHRYVMTEKGRAAITAVLAAHQASVCQLTKMAA
jgi:hypothetical protein